MTGQQHILEQAQRPNKSVHEEVKKNQPGVKNWIQNIPLGKGQHCTKEKTQMDWAWDKR